MRPYIDPGGRGQGTAGGGGGWDGEGGPDLVVGPASAVMLVLLEVPD